MFSWIRRTNSRVMPKNFIQTKLSFSSSQSESSTSSVEKPSLKRKFTDTDAVDGVAEKRTMASYADKARLNSHQSAGAGRGRDNTFGKDTHGQSTHGVKPGGSRQWDRKIQETDAGSSKDMTGRVSNESKSVSAGSSSRTFALSSGSSDDQDSERKRTDNSQTQESPNSPDQSDGEEDMDMDDGVLPKRQIENAKPSSAGEGKSKWEGIPLKNLKRAPECYKEKLSSLTPSREHKVFFKVRLEKNQMYYSPYPDHYQDKWEDDYVYMPCSWSNTIPGNSYEGTVSRWEKIKKALGKPIPGVYELQDTILSYNAHYNRKWNFDSLVLYCQDRKAGDRFITEILPEMQKLALKLPLLCTKPIPILKKWKNRKLTMSQEQVACLLANAFFCTFPRRNFKVKGGKLPDINFSHLFGADSRGNRKLEKIKCIINYFRRVTKDMPTGTITYARQCLGSEKPNWFSLGGKGFTELHISTEGTIEDDGEGMLQADFANKYVGGGVLGHGLVQEEIRFMLCPEMIISRLFTEALEEDEVLIMTGCERYNDYTGYGDTFKFDGNYVDKTSRDEWGRKFTEVVAMDALIIRDFRAQFEDHMLTRELTKAYCAFRGTDFEDNLPAVRTGNWGCGAFGGDKHLKALIQMIAASAVGRDVCYFTFGDAQLCSEIAGMHNIIKNENLKIKEVLNIIHDFRRELKNRKKTTLAQYFKNIFPGSDRNRHIGASANSKGSSEDDEHDSNDGDDDSVKESDHNDSNKKGESSESDSSGHKDTEEDFKANTP